MLINIITTIDNGAGLQADAMLLKRVVENLGHSVRLVHRSQLNTLGPADLSIFLELVNHEMLNAAPRNWLMPNPEWYFPKHWDRYLPKFELVLCKTYDCRRLMSKHHSNCIYTGFMATDFLDAKVERRPEFLHVKGKSEYKNTAAVIEAWNQYKIQAPLTIVAKHNPLRKDVANITWRGYVSIGTLRALYNSRLFHLCPSEYEGYGHYIHEALSCGAVVVTTEAPPMNEFEGCPAELRIPSDRVRKVCTANLHKVSPEAVRDAVLKCFQLDQETIRRYSERARATFQAANEEFQRRLGQVLAT